MKNRYIYCILIGTLLLAGFSTAVSAETISVSPASTTVDRGSSTTFQVVLDNAPDGISGYSLEISLVNPVVAQITAVSYPSWVTFKETIGVPSDAVTISGSDSDEQVQPGATGITLASFTVRGDSGGSTGIELVVDILDADGGDPIEADVSGATITVESSSGSTVTYTTTATTSSSSTSTATTRTTTTTAPVTTRQTTSPSGTTITTAVTTTAPPAGTAVPTISQETTAAPATTTVPAASPTNSLPIPLTWIVAVVVVMAGSATVVIYLVATKRI